MRLPAAAGPFLDVVLEYPTDLLSDRGKGKRRVTRTVTERRLDGRAFVCVCESDR